MRREAGRIGAPEHQRFVRQGAGVVDRGGRRSGRAGGSGYLCITRTHDPLNRSAKNTTLVFVPGRFRGVFES
jgi:hypothetical protein